MKLKTHPFSFLNHLEKLYYQSQIVEIEEVMERISSIRYQSSLFPFSPAVFYVIDYSQHQYLMLTDSIKSIIGYDAREFLEGGISRLIDVYNEDDFRIYNESVFKENQLFIKENYKADESYSFSYNFRVKSKKNTTVHIFQQGTYLIDPVNRAPIYSMGIINDISAFKSDSLIVHRVDKIDPITGGREGIMTNFFFPNEEDSLLTKKEKDVLCYLADGMCSKEIAGKLRISVNTVDNHRRNMLKKTNSRNIAQLVSFAIRSRII